MASFWILVVDRRARVVPVRGLVHAAHRLSRQRAALRPDSDEFLHVDPSHVSGGRPPSQRHRDPDERRPVLSCDARRDRCRRKRRSTSRPISSTPAMAADMLIDAMVTRARAGVDVRLVLDSIGSARMTGEPARRLREAGCQSGVLSADHLVPAPPLEQPDSPRAAHRGRALAFTGRSRRRGLVAQTGRTTRPRGATRWCESKDRSSPPCRAFLPKTGSSAAARF